MGLPYVINGTITDNNGVNIGSGVVVRVRNEITNQTLNTTTNSSGQYVLDAGNFSEGYLSTDTFTVYIIYTNLEGQSSFLVSSNTHTVDIQLSIITDSSTINYCTVQDVWDELDGLTSSDISANRIIKSIQRAESEIDNETNTTFISTTYTQEIHDYNQYNSYRSPEQQLFPSMSIPQRNDYMNVNYNDSIRLDHYPIISITTLQRNTAGDTSADNWETLTEQTGSGGDYLFDSDTGWVFFIKKVPRYGKRALRVTYVAGYSTVPNHVERLTILLAIKGVLLSKINRSQFDSIDNISLQSISISKGVQLSAVWLKSFNDELDRLWSKVGQMESTLV